MDVDRIIPTGYTSFATVLQGRQNNIHIYGATKGSSSLFGTDTQQAQDVAQFRQTHCRSLSGATCDGFVQEALDDRMKRAGILTAAAIAVPVGVNRFRSLRLPGKPIATKIKPVTSGGGANTTTGSKVVAQEVPKGGNSGGKSVVGPAEQGIAGIADQVPKRVQLRINISNEGMGHVLDRHFDPSVNASQFTISKSNLRSLLNSKEVISTPVARIVQSGNELTYVREVNIGLDKFGGNQPTSTLTVLTDKYGNLLTTFPGKLK